MLPSSHPAMTFLASWLMTTLATRFSPPPDRCLLSLVVSLSRTLRKMGSVVSLITRGQGHTNQMLIYQLL